MMIYFHKALTFPLAPGSESTRWFNLVGPDVLHVVLFQMHQQRYSPQQPPEFHISGNMQQQRYKLMMKLLEKKYFQINSRKMADILLSLK